MGKGELYFKVDAQDIDRRLPADKRFKTIWLEKNTEVKVPVGEWFTLEYYCKEGDRENGRFYMTIETKGEINKPFLISQIIHIIVRIHHLTELQILIH